MTYSPRGAKLPKRPAAPVLKLTPAEQALVGLIALGMNNREAAEASHTSEHVIKNRLRVIYDKLGLWNRVELALWHVAHEISEKKHSLPKDPTP